MEKDRERTDSMRDVVKSRGITIGLIAPFPPPLGGMAIQATKLAENLTKEGFNVVNIATNLRLPKPLGPLETLAGVRTIARSICLLEKIRRDSVRIDVFYFLTGFFDFFFWVTMPVLLLLKMKGSRVVLSARGGDAGRFFARWKPFVKPVLAVPQTITVPSAFLQHQFSKHLGIKTLVVPNIADLDQFHFRSRRQLRPRFIATRHLEKMYNVGCVIHAFKKIAEAYPESTLTIVGDGSQKVPLQGLAHSLGLNGRVAFLGRVPHEQLPALYDSHDIFINASNVDNMPGAILEAFASGLPVVTTRAGGIPFLVEHEKTGFTVDLDDSGALARFAMALLENPESAQAIARNAFHYVQNCSWSNVRRTLVPLLDPEKPVLRGEMNG